MVKDSPRHIGSSARRCPPLCPEKHVQVPCPTCCACCTDGTAPPPEFIQCPCMSPSLVRVTPFSPQECLPCCIYHPGPTLHGAAKPHRTELGWVTLPEAERSFIPAWGGLETKEFAGQTPVHRLTMILMSLPCWAGAA